MWKCQKFWILSTKLTVTLQLVSCNKSINWNVISTPDEEFPAYKIYPLDRSYIGRYIRIDGLKGSCGYAFAMVYIKFFLWKYWKRIVFPANTTIVLFSMIFSYLLSFIFHNLPNKPRSQAHKSTKCSHV